MKYNKQKSPLEKGYEALPDTPGGALLITLGMVSFFIVLAMVF